MEGGKVRMEGGREGKIEGEGYTERGIECDGKLK